MTDLLATIDDVIADWETQPQAWNPGDPIWQDPRESEHSDVQVVRPMLQLIDEWEPTARCEPCDVSWDGISACWNCGAERPPTGVGMSSNYGFMVGMTVAAGNFQRAMAAMREVMTRELDGRLDELIGRAEPPPLPVLTAEQLEQAMVAVRNVRSQ